MMMTPRQKLIRAGLVVVWFLVGAVMFITSRGHTLLVDNRNTAVPAIEAPKEIVVSLDGKEGTAFYRGDRDRFILTGSKHRITVAFTDGRPPFESEFTLPLKDDMYLLSVPRLLNGIDPFVEVFHTTPEPRNEEETGEDTAL